MRYFIKGFEPQYKAHIWDGTDTLCERVGRLGAEYPLLTDTTNRQICKECDKVWDKLKKVMQDMPEDCMREMARLK